MSKLRVLVALLVVGLLAGCVYPFGIPTGIAGSGRMVTSEKDLSGFTKVEVGSAFTADIKQSENYRVAITVDDNLAEYVNASVQGDTLRVYLKPNVSLRTFVNRPKVEIEMPQIESLTLSGATQGTLTGFKSDTDFALDLSGASGVGGQIEAGDVRAQVSGASKVTLEGKGGNLNLQCSGASRAELGNFPVKDARVELSGASRATVNASGRLSGEASGASQLGYKGNPTLGDLQTSGASTIRPE